MEETSESVLEIGGFDWKADGIPPEEEEETINVWKRQFCPEIIIKSPAFFEMEKYIEMVCEGHSNFCVICSRGGLAKTWSSKAILRKKGVDYAYLNSFTSPLELYNFLYDNRDNKVILIDDCEGIWGNRAIVSLLKNATELNGRRTISWNSTTYKLDGRTNSCPFNSRIILLTNQLPDPRKSLHIQALLNRAFLCKLKLSYGEKMEIIRLVSRREYQSLTPQERQDICEFLERNTSEATPELSIRTLIKCYHFYLFNKELWKELALRTLKADPRKEVVLGLIKSGMSAKEQERAYTEKTGHSRADFYRIKRGFALKEVRPGREFVKREEAAAKDVPAVTA